MARTSDASEAAPSALGPRIAEVYGGPLGEFVARRDALVRELRSSGRRDEAAEVKALRKPKALAWALDAGVHDDPESFAELDAAVEQVSEAQDGSGDVRGAIARLRTAEASVVAAADAAARGHDHPVDRTALAAAVRAVVGSTAAMDELRAGRLVDTTPVADDGPDDEGMWAVPAPSRVPRRTSRGGSPGRGAKGGKATDDGGRDDEAAAPPVDPKAARAARRAVAAAERAATKAGTAADEAEAAAADADAAARTAEDEAADARKRADELADAARRARERASARAAERDEAASELAQARAALDELAPANPQAR